MSGPRIELAEWMVALRAELGKAQRQEAERQREVLALPPSPDRVLPPSFRLEEVVVELTVTTEVSGKVSGTSSFKLVVEVEAEAEIGAKRASGQKIQLKLRPVADALLGDGGKKDLF